MKRPSSEASRTNGNSTQQSSSILQPSITRSATAEIGGHILLVDHTKPEAPEDDELADLPSDTSGVAPVRTSTNIDPVSRTTTHGSLRETIARRKYRKYREERTVDRTQTRDAQESPAENGAAEDEAGADNSKWGRNRVDRGKSKVGDFVRGKKAGVAAGRKEIDSSVDILYENQRGAFFCGIPRFSSASLLNFDPSAWLDGHFKPSAVDITNAQVPDPSWSWDWRTWYVDMSHDVDEEGWEYSFWFLKGCSWHGTHPWFHSFVRRRRWVRKRVRRQGEKKPKDEAHALNPDYFTIHTKGAASQQSDDATSLGYTKEMVASARPSSGWGATSWRDQQDEEDIEDIPSLMKALRKAKIDREKVYFVRKFVDQAGDELHYFADEIPHIMALLVFQTSRRQLLKFLMEKFDAASEEYKADSTDQNSDDDRSKRKLEYLHKAVEMADEQCKRLEFWSDVRHVVREGQAVHAAADEQGWGPEWQGIDASGPDPDAAFDDAESEEDAKDDAPGKGKEKEKAHEESEDAQIAKNAEGAEQSVSEDSMKDASGSKNAVEANNNVPHNPAVRTHGLTAVQPEQVKE